MGFLRTEKSYWTIITILGLVLISQCSNRGDVSELYITTMSPPLEPILLQANPVEQSPEPVFRGDSLESLRFDCSGIFTTKQDGEDVMVIPTVIAIDSTYSRESNVIARSSRIVNEYRISRVPPTVIVGGERYNLSFADPFFGYQRTYWRVHLPLKEALLESDSMQIPTKLGEIDCKIRRSL